MEYMEIFGQMLWSKNWGGGGVMGGGDNHCVHPSRQGSLAVTSPLKRYLYWYANPPREQSRCAACSSF